jgi:hypothetical protein
MTFHSTEDTMNNQKKNKERQKERKKERKNRGDELDMAFGQGIVDDVLILLYHDRTWPNQNADSTGKID